MTARSGRLRATALTIVLSLVATVIGLIGTGTPAGASAKPIGACTTSTGVILAVDFSHWGGPILRSCGTTPTTGYQLLNEGGWRTAGDSHDGPAFVCRIGYSGYHGGTEYPTAAQDPCILTPPASAYWSYWHADPGHNTWSYSQLGAMSYHPKPGSVDLWIFGGTNIAGTEGVPTVSPNSVRARNTTPATKPTVAHTTRPAPTTASTTGATRPTATPTTARVTVTPSTGAATPTPQSSCAPTSTPCIADAPPAAAAHVSHGSITPAVTALVIVVLLGGAGIAVMLRRPRRER